MANLKETSFWEEGIYQWETSDPVLGGENGIDNVPTRQLANRTKWLKDNKLDKSATAANAELAKKARTADRLTDARKVGGVAFDGSADIDLPGVNKPGNQNTSGNAGSAFKLYNPRKINGVPFDGTQDINATPAGAVMYFAMDAAPVGWLKANGAAVSRTLYANLFAAIGIRFGAGDGKTTFNLPDLRGEFLRGWDDGRGLDAKRIFSSPQSDAVQDWTAGFTYQRAELRRKYELIEGGFKIKAMNEIGLGNPLDHAEGWSVGFGVLGPGINNVARTANETRPHNIAFLACIKI
ncbi:phage tail protein [Snodgrassella gandavensis]|uniref:phage tail protein n=1 Tax=Snodgrassella gandavensis TaxID=2946698 RepID=UPI001EF417D0|nr:phage tail protein [Snodgrassella gandavensis]